MSNASKESFPIDHTMESKEAEAHVMRPNDETRAQAQNLRNGEVTLVPRPTQDPEDPLASITATREWTLYSASF